MNSEQNKRYTIVMTKKNPSSMFEINGEILE